jgi:hypothetical protein
MTKLSLGRIIAGALAAATLAAAAVTATVTQQQQPTQPTACSTARISLNASALKAGDELIATVSVVNCSAEKERVVVKYSYTDPCGNKTDMGSAPLKLAAGETQAAKINFLAPSAECAGTFKINAVVVSSGKELTNTSATFTVAAK